MIFKVYVRSYVLLWFISLCAGDSLMLRWAYLKWQVMRVGFYTIFSNFGLDIICSIRKW